MCMRREQCRAWPGAVNFIERLRFWTVTVGKRKRNLVEVGGGGNIHTQKCHVDASITLSDAPRYTKHFACGLWAACMVQHALSRSILFLQGPSCIVHLKKESVWSSGRVTHFFEGVS